MKRFRLIALGVVLALVLIVAGAVGVARFTDNGDDIGIEADAPVVAPDAVADSGGPAAADLDGLIAQLQTRLEKIPKDSVAWATLGLAYVQQARVTVDPSYYPRAEGALDESLKVGPDDNFLVFAGYASLANARHEFANARDFAQQGLVINDFSAILYGALSDAELQLGNYDAATAAVDRMTELAPDTPAFSRSSYLAELRGDPDLAATLMQTALDDAGSPSDSAFALTILGDIAFDTGRPGDALTLYNQAREAQPNDVLSLYGKARSEFALGQVQTSLEHYAELVAIAPEPSFLIAYGEALESLGRDDEAAQQYAVVDSVQKLFDANGVELDAGPILYLAEHGDPAVALSEAELAVGRRPFLAVHDAHAWALHVNGRDEEALVAIGQAQELGTRSALFSFHSGMIKLGLGDEDGARADLQNALDINPFFDALDVDVAETTLAELDGGS